MYSPIVFFPNAWFHIEYMKKYIILFASIIVVISIGITAYLFNSTESNISSEQDVLKERIIGDWTQTGTDEAGIVSFTKTYSFLKDGTYLYVGYPTFSQQGQYKVFSAEDGEDMLHLFEKSGDLSLIESTSRITLDQGTLSIDEDLYTAVTYK